MENISKSEKYRKYLIGLQFKDLKGYAIWGTDMEDLELDKLLVKENKLIVFKNLDEIGYNLKDIKSPFLDVDNFERWVIEENLSKVYHENEIKLLWDFNMDLLSDKSVSIELLNCLNLIQDFFIQVNDDFNKIFDEQSMGDLKDFIYNNYFWKKKPSSKDYNFWKDVPDLLNKLYINFYDCITIV